MLCGLAVVFAGGVLLAGDLRRRPSRGFVGRARHRLRTPFIVPDLLKLLAGRRRDAGAVADHGRLRVSRPNTSR